ncbi:MAG: type II toxin-antitoxin system VapC family toxin [Propionibacterium sp.]|nr:type II toxin-antitoxin system VapC family toxin [Propionibacterium sp.]
MATDFTDELVLMRIDDALMAEAAAIRPHVKTLDALHLASAQRVGVTNVTVVTHDATMLRVADALGFDVLDPT